MVHVYLVNKVDSFIINNMRLTTLIIFRASSMVALTLVNILAGLLYFGTTCQLVERQSC